MIVITGSSRTARIVMNSDKVSTAKKTVYYT